MLKLIPLRTNPANSMYMKKMQRALKLYQAISSTIASMKSDASKRAMEMEFLTIRIPDLEVVYHDNTSFLNAENELDNLISVLKDIHTQIRMYFL